MRHDLDATPLSVVLDDARSLSLFAPERVIWVASAEGVLPRGRAIKAEDESGPGAIREYMRRPTPGTVVVFEASRFGFDDEDKAKLERVQKFYGAIADQVEFRPYTPASARRVAQDLARDAGLQIGISELGLLVEVLGGDVARIANEIEKLRLYAGSQRKVTAEDIRDLVPDAQVATIFALVGALGRGDRKGSLDSLDTLMRQGEYLPMALTFLGTQFRLAKVAQEAKLRNTQQILSYFTQQGIRIWPGRAGQVQETLAAFQTERLDQAIKRVFQADKALRDARPDDRVVMEELVLALTAP